MMNALSSIVSVAQTNKCPETPHKPSEFIAGLLPEFQLLILKTNKAQSQGREENVTPEKESKNSSSNIQSLSTRVFFGNDNSSSRWALSTLQALRGSKIAEAQVPRKVTVAVPQVPSRAMKRQKPSPPRSQKRPKTVRHGGHGIRKTKAKPPPRSNASRITRVPKSAEQNCPSKDSKKRNINSSQGSYGEFSGSYDDDEMTSELHLEVDCIVDHLESEEPSEESSNNVLSKIAELIDVVQEIDMEGPVDSSPTDVHLSPKKEKEVDDLLVKLLGFDTEGGLTGELTGLHGPSSDNGAESTCQSQGSTSSVSSLHKPRSIVSEVESPVIAIRSVTAIEQHELEELCKRIDQSSYKDPDDTDPFLDCGSVDDIECEKRSVKFLADDKPTQNIMMDTSTSEGFEETVIDCKFSELKSECKSSAINDAPVLSVQADASKSPPNKQQTNAEVTSDSSNDGYFSCQSSPAVSKTDIKNPANMYCSSTAGICSDPKISKKLFPVFTKRNSPVSSSGRKTNSLPQASLPRPDKDGKEQLLLDAGQKKFGVEVCPKCSFLFDPDDRRDVQAHLAHHNRFETGLRHKGWKGERIVEQLNEDARILMIEPQDPISWWRRILTVLETVNYDLGFQEDFELQNIKSSTRKVFLFISGKQITGCLVAEKIKEAHKLLPVKEDVMSEDTYPATCGVVRIWTAKYAQRRGFASLLMNSLRENFLVERNLELSEIAMSSPSQSGRAFATKYFGTPTFLVY